MLGLQISAGEEYIQQFEQNPRIIFGITTDIQNHCPGQDIGATRATWFGVAARQLDRARHGRPVFATLRSTKDPARATVVLEHTANLTGIAGGDGTRTPVLGAK